MLIDMPLEQLRTYTGRNPRPADFDAFWDRALAEMRAVDPKVEMTRHDIGADAGTECFDLWFTGVRGARIHAQYLRPKAGEGKAANSRHPRDVAERHPRDVAERHPAVVIFHGYSGNAGAWTDKLCWTSLGFSVAAMDCRGQGGQSEDAGAVKGTTLRGHIIRGLDDGPDNMMFRHIYLDAAQLAGIVMGMPEVDPARVGCTGGSQGGGLTIACAALEPRISRAFPVYPFLCDYQRVWELDLAKDAYEELRYYFRSFDPQHQREREVFARLGYIDNQHLAPRIRGEVRMATGLMDTVCPPSTQFAAFNRMSCPKSMLLYPDFGHEGLPLINDHVFAFMAGL
jgi:cephalosporin-C deacetylase